MGNHWKCKKCGSMNVEKKPYKRFEASATIYKDEQDNYDGDVGFGTKEEEIGVSSFFCKDCKNLDDNEFELMPDTD